MNVADDSIQIGATQLQKTSLYCYQHTTQPFVYLLHIALHLNMVAIVTHYFLLFTLWPVIIAHRIAKENG